MNNHNEIDAYLENKSKILKTIVSAISEAHANGRAKIYIKSLQIMGEEIDAIAEREEWPVCLQKALDFFESTEDYESCQECKNLMTKIENPPKKMRKNVK